MAFEFYKEKYNGKIKEISIGSGKNAVTVGGETCYPFYEFEGSIPKKPKVAMEIWDHEPKEWPEAAIAPFKDVAKDPVKWAKKCIEEYGAEMIVLQLKSTDPNDQDRSAADASKVVQKVSKAIDVPLIVWGVLNSQKDEEVLKKIAEDCEGQNLTLGPVEDANHKGIGAAAMGYGHTIISSSPIDVNLAKQVNILLENLGMPMDRILIDPTTGGIGYGLEYSYSVMERLRMAALAQGDDKLQMPIINNLGNEVWKCKEANQSAEEMPALGDPEKRGIMMEAVAAVTYLMAGSDILVMRHPEAIRLVKSFIDLMMDGGSAKDIEPVKKLLKDTGVDLTKHSPKPDLTIEEEKKAAAPAAKKSAPKKEAPKAAAPKAASKAAPKEAPAPKAEAKPEPAAAAPAVDEAKVKAEAEAKAKLEAEAKAKAEAEAKVKAEEEAKAKAEAEAKAKADAKLAAEKAEAAKREAQEEEIRQKRAKEREDRMAKMKKEVKSAITMTPAKEQKPQTEKMLDLLNRIHKRVA